MEASQRNISNNQLHSLPRNNTIPLPDPDIFAFLKADEEERHLRSPSFFSENGLGQDIIQVTNAEPDVYLEVFYALYSTLWPQIEKRSDVSFKDAWIGFIGGSITKGSLCPPEKLIAERRIRDIKRILSEDDGEALIFHDLDQVVNSISHLKQKIKENIHFHKEIIASLDLVQEFYLRFRNQLRAYVQAILDKEQTNVSYVLELEALEDLLEPKAIMVSDIFKKHWAYRIPRNRARKLLSLDMYGRNIKSNLNDPSNHRVISLPEKTPEPLVFFKANGNPPIQPEKEFMAYSLYRHLQIPVPETALLILTDVFDTNPEYFYAVQASEAVLGESPLKACQDPETIFDQEAYTLQVIGALLTNPSDGSFKNFKYSPAYETLISIDNDLVFKPELTAENTVNVKSILYLLDKIDLPIPDSIKTSFTTLDPHLTVFAWLQDLSKKNQEYNLLFTKLAFQKTRCIYENLLPQSETPSVEFCLQQKISVDPELSHELFSPHMLISRSLLNNLTQKLQIIERTLLNNRSVSLQSLFEEISPALGKYYRKLRLEFNDTEEALEALWGNKKNGIDYSEMSSLLDLEELNGLPEIRLDETLPPEKFFEEFQSTLKSGDSALDRFIRRHNERLKKNVLNLRAALRELRFLSDKGLINSRSIRDIVDFCHSLSKILNQNHHLIKEIASILSNLPHPELKWLFTLEKYIVRADRSVPKDLMSSSALVVGALMKQRTFLLSESENQYLFDQQGDIRKNPFLTGRSCVTCFPQENPEFYLKQYPEWPGYEFASTFFMRLLGIQHLPYYDLIIIKNYPVLLSQKVPGIPVIHVWNNPKAFHNLDSFHTTLLIISAMLLNPEDGKEDNFILSSDGRYLIPIDNDHCFLPSFFQKEGNFWNAFTVNIALQTKTLLFCLDEMYMPIPPEVKQHILSINFDERLPQWMVELDKLENQFNNLIDQNQRNRFLEQGTVMRIPFYKQFIENMHWKAHKIQNILKTEPKPTAFDLLKAVEPFATKCYQDSFKQGSDLQTRFKAATNQLYTKTAIDGSRVSILNTRTMMEIVNISEEELQKDAAFQRMGPVDAVELLNQLSQERVERVKFEQELLYELDAKIQETKWLSLFGNSPVETSLKAFLTDPKEGLALKGSKVITSNKLTELFAQAPDKAMRIRFLSLPESPLLAEKEIRILAEECPNLEYLNVSGCGKLKQITTTQGEWPLLARLEAKDCLNLEKLVSYSPMRILRIGTDSKIEILVEKSTLDIFAISKKKLEFDLSIKIGEGFQVKYQYRPLYQENFEQFIISPVERLKEYFQGLKMILGTYSISSPNDLAVFVTVINLQNLKIKAENMQRMTSLKLRNLTLQGDGNVLMGANLLKYLVEADWPKLNDFSIGIISDDGMQILAQGNWPLLEFLNIRSEKVTEDGVKAITSLSKWPQLKHLNLFDSNDMTEKAVETLSQGNWSYLDTLSLSGKSLTKKAFVNLILRANWPNLSKISLTSDENNFSKNLLQQNWPRVEELDLSLGGITQNEIELIVKKPNWPQLKHLNLSGNVEIGDKGLEALSQGDWPLIEILNLRETKITAVGIEAVVTRSKWPKLKHLNLSFNSGISDEGLETLSRGDWPLLEVLNLEYTRLTKKTLLNVIVNLNWPSLKEITFDEFGESFANGLLQRNWVRLENLDLSYSKITNHEIELIVNKYKWPQLKYLNLSENDFIGDEEIEILSQGDWPLLKTLNLERTKITAIGIEIITIQSKWPKLKHLNLSENAEIGDKGLATLSGGNWPLLKTLSLSNTKITSVGIEAIVARSKWLELSCLNLSANDGIRDSGLEVLSRGNWPLLETLSLKSTGGTIKGVFNLLLRANWPNLKETNFDEFAKNLDLLPKNAPQLEEQNLSDCGIAQNEIELIVKRFNWPQLLLISLSFNSGINDEALDTLSQANWPRLEYLDLRGTQITEKGLFSLLARANWPNLKKIYWDGDDFEKNLLPKNWPLAEELDLSHSKFTKNEVESMVNNYKWPRLKHLNLSFNYEINEEALAILSQGNWPLLETLNLRSTNLTNSKFLSLLFNANWPNFKEIIGFSSPTKNLAESLIKKDLSQVQRLDFRNSKITLPEIESILKRNKYQCPQLRYLNLSNHHMFGEGKISALAVTECPLMEELHLENTKLTPEQMMIILTRSKWPQLKRFNVSNNEISDEGIYVLTLAKWPLLENLNLSNTKLEFKRIRMIINRTKWLQIKCLNISNNQISDMGLAALAFREWTLLEDLNLRNTQMTQQEIEILVSRMKLPKLKKLDISENTIFDEGLSTLLSGKWPLFQHLVYSQTKVTGQGTITLLENFKWPNLHQLEHSVTESFYNFTENLDEWSPPNILLAMAPMCYKPAGGKMQRCLVSVLDMSWLNSKEIYLSLEDGDLKGTILMLPREKLDQLETIDISLESLPIQLVLWPPNLKRLNLCGNPLVDETKLESLLRKNYPSLEILNLAGTKITAVGIEAIVTRSNWLELKHLNLSENTEIGDKGLEILSQGDWPLLEILNLGETKITALGIEALVTRSKWPKLKNLNLSFNSGILDEGLEMLSRGNWPLLETLSLKSTGGTMKGVFNLLLRANWPNIKETNFDESAKDLELFRRNSPQLEEIDLSDCGITQNEIELIVKKFNWPQLKRISLSLNPQINDDALETLSQGDWPLLEYVNLRRTEITTKGLFNLVGKAKWPNLKELDWEIYSFAESLLPKNWSHLEKLDLSFSKLTNNEIELMVNHYKLPQLKLLNLCLNNEITEEGLAILTRGNWPRLETLYLTTPNLTHKKILNFLLHANWPNFKEIIGWSDLAKSLAESFVKKDLSQVERLELINSKVSFPEIESILKRNKYKCPQLRFLSLYNHHIFGEGKISAIAVTECPLLEELHLENTKLTPEQMKILVTRAKWPRLKYFNVARNEIFDEGISVLTLAEWPSLEKLNLGDTKLQLKRTENILNQPKWLQIKSLNLSYNEISDEGFSALALKEWTLLEELHIKNTKITQQGIEILVNKIHLPSLKRLNVSENAIFDEGLKTIASGNWPLFQHLAYYETKVTEKGHVALLENFKWQNLSHLEHSLTESFYNFSENLDEWSPPKILLAMAPMYKETAGSKLYPYLVSVLDLSWLNSKEISLSIDCGDLNRKILMLPREKLNQLDTIDLSLKISPIQLILWPPNLKTLGLSGNSLADETKLESLLRRNCPSLESLEINEKTNIAAKGIQVLIRQSNWSNLKRIHISKNIMKNEELEIFACGDWQILEDLLLTKTGMRAQGVEILVRKSNWPNLKKLNISDNPIGDEGLEMLASGKWQLLEDLEILRIKTKVHGIKALISSSNWPNLKKLSIGFNPIGDEGLEMLASGKWQLLEDLKIIAIGVKAQGTEALVRKSNWPSLKKLSIGLNPIGDEGLEILTGGKWQFLEDLHLAGTEITSKGLEALISKSDWPNLKRLSIGLNPIGDEGLEILTGGKWQFLEDLYLAGTEITSKGLEALISKSDWPRLKTLGIGVDDIPDEGLEILTSGKWPLLEKLYLFDLEITKEGIERMVKISDWPNLKILDLSDNDNISGALPFVSEKWPLLESLRVCNTNMTLKDVETFVNQSSWLNLKEIYLEEEDRDDDDEIDAIQKLISEKWPQVKVRMKDYQDLIISEFFGRDCINLIEKRK